MRPTCGKPRSVSAPASETQAAETPSWAPARRSAADTDYQAILHGNAGGYHLHILAAGQWTVWRGRIRQAPCRLAAGAHPGLLYGGGTLATGSPAAHYQRPKQAAGAGMDGPPHTGLKPRPGEASGGRMARRRHPDDRCPGPPRGAHHPSPPSSHPRGGATRAAGPEVGSLHVQPGGRAHRRLRPRTPAGA